MKSPRVAVVEFLTNCLGHLMFLLLSRLTMAHIETCKDVALDIVSDAVAVESEAATPWLLLWSTRSSRHIRRHY